ncbi:MAG: endonuclease/exonuclease/phosphatase family protein [Corynebacterium sp.]|nr:endonuclease/exonuclease/phosphatase family protein [Corynebacterium sp.]
MKLLSLNVHSWMEIHPSEKLLHLAQAIVAHRVDIVALQEVNQLRLPEPDYSTEPSSRVSSQMRLPHPAAGFDNFAALLCQLLASWGEDYTWYWSPAHIGFERYDEGVAILVRQDSFPVTTQKTLVLTDHPYNDVRRRVAQAVCFQDFWVASGHFSWWERDGAALFRPEWDTLQAFSNAQLDQGKPTLVAGDLNNPASVIGEGFDYVRSLGWLDTYQLCAEPQGANTIMEPIAGWEDTTGPRRIDYVLSNTAISVTQHSVIFDGKNFPVVSDHYGLLVELRW